MGNTHQPPLGFHLLQTAQMESSETHVVFLVAKYCLYLGGASGSQSLPFFTGQVLSGLLAVVQQAKANAHLAIAFGLGTKAAQWTAGAVEAFVETPVAEVAIVAGIARSILEV
jgi:hypothetical protein